MSVDVYISILDSLSFNILEKRKQLEIANSNLLLYCSYVKTFIQDTNNMFDWYSYKDYRWIEHVEYIQAERNFRVSIFADFAGSDVLDYCLIVPVEAFALYLDGRSEEAGKLVNRIDRDGTDAFDDFGILSNGPLYIG